MTLPFSYWLLIFVVSLAVLIKASASFTNAAEKLGLRLGIPAFLIGGTIVALGTSLPELVSSILSVVKNSPEIVLGNVVGSNVTNILLVLGSAAVIAKKIKIHHRGLKRDLLVLSAATIWMGIVCYDGWFSKLDAITGIILIAFHIFYIVYSHKYDSKRELEEKLIEEASLLAEQSEDNLEMLEPNPDVLESTKGPVEWRIPATLLISGLFIYGGAQWTIEAVIQISEGIGIGKELIAITAVALGTSLPELTVTLSAAARGKAEIAIGNVLGSNLFNTLYVLSIPGSIGALPVPPSILSFGLPAMLGATLLFIFTTVDRRVSLIEGSILLSAYALFMIGLFL